MIFKLEMPKKGEICLFKIYYMPIFMCGAETWSWTRADISRLTATEMIFLRSRKLK
jgi:hypothetical protein